MTSVEGGPPETEADWRRVTDTLFGDGGGELAGLGGGHAPSHHVAGVDVDDDEQLVVDAAFGPLSPIPPASGSDRSRG